MITERLMSLTAAVILTFNSVQAGSCPQHVLKVPHSYTAVHHHVCYLFVDNELYWSQARERCWDLGGEMISIENQETMDFIQEKLNSPELSWDRNGVWLGASKVGGRWRWTNGRAVDYTNWDRGQPSNIFGILSVEDCSQMRQKNGWKWHDIPCGSLDFHYNYICQFPLSKPGDVMGRVSASAANQSEENGNSSILAIIVGIGASLLLIMGMIFLVLQLRFRKKKQKTSDVAVHFSNNTYQRTPNGQAYPNNPVAPVPASRLPYSSSDELYLSSLENNSGGNHIYNDSSNSCKCTHQQTKTITSMGSSPGTDSELGACGGSDPEIDMQVPLMAGASSLNGNNDATCGSNHNCCSTSQGEYIDMNIIAQQKEKERLITENNHTYSNVDHRESRHENLYEVLH